MVLQLPSLLLKVLPHLHFHTTFLCVFSIIYSHKQFLMVYQCEILNEFLFLLLGSLTYSLKATQQVFLFHLIQKFTVNFPKAETSILVPLDNSIPGFSLLANPNLINFIKFYLLISI